MQDRFRAQSVEQLQELSEHKQQRLEDLLARHNDGDVTGEELSELRALESEVEELAHSNAQRLPS